MVVIGVMVMVMVMVMVKVRVSVRVRVKRKFPVDRRNSSIKSVGFKVVKLINSLVHIKSSFFSKRDERDSNLISHSYSYFIFISHIFDRLYRICRVPSRRSDVARLIGVDWVDSKADVTLKG